MQRVDGRYAALIDSSKTAWGSITAPFRLKRKFGRDFILLHLTREPAAVCWSVLKQKNRRAYRGELTHYTLRCSWIVLGWSIANFSCDLFGMLYPQQYVRLRYEDLARSPTEILGKLFARLMPDVQWDSEEVAGDNRHQLYGNKVRHRAIGIEDVKEDIKWKAEMPPEYSRIVQPLSYLLRLRYGYS
jgi:hypothetical protein